jgi:hypothetical protein
MPTTPVVNISIVAGSGTASSVNARSRPRQMSVVPFCTCSVLSSPPLPLNHAHCTEPAGATEEIDSQYGTRPFACSGSAALAG